MVVLAVHYIGHYISLQHWTSTKFSLLLYYIRRLLHQGGGELCRVQQGVRAPAKELARGSLRARLRVWEREGAGRISLQMYFEFFAHLVLNIVR